MFGTNLFAESVFADLPNLDFTEVEYNWQLACKVKNTFTTMDAYKTPWQMVKSHKYTVTPCKE